MLLVVISNSNHGEIMRTIKTILVAATLALSGANAHAFG